MFFLLRIAFWLGIVLILLPSGGTRTGPSLADVDASQAASAASATVHDLAGFCTREPTACTVGSQIASAMAHRAQAGAKMLFGFLNDAFATREAGGHGGNAPAASPESAARRASQDTLTPTDLAPAWHGPAVHSPDRHSA